MRQELNILFITYSAYTVLQDSPWITRAMWVGLSILILKFTPEYSRQLIMAILTWNVIDAFMNISKNEGDNKCTSIVSILKNALTGEKVLEQNLKEKESMSSFSQPPMDELIPPRDSTSTQPSMVVQ